MPSDDAPPLRFEKVDGRLLVTVDGTDEVTSGSDGCCRTAAVGDPVLWGKWDIFCIVFSTYDLYCQSYS
ncbi:hypothetical protein C8039_03065 [Halogeometricum sp. wsp3]|nr:hypothetical protein C8039_03065 [Halogeometricum sp. wsp3]